MDYWTTIALSVVFEILKDKRLFLKHKKALQKLFALLTELLTPNEQDNALRQLAAKRKG